MKELALQDFMEIVKDMRQAQKDYFQHRTAGRLQAAKTKEQHVDRLLDKYLKKQSYQQTEIEL